MTSAGPWMDNIPLAVVTGVACFVIFMLTLYPDLSGGDSGELTAAAYLLGVGHPPGYPLYAMLGKFFSLLIPFGNVAYRVNVGTAAVGALAASYLFLTVARYCRHDACGLLAAGLYSFCPLVWSFHIQGEVFAYNNFFVCWLLYLSLTYFDTLETRTARWGAFVMGLGLTNQHTLIVFEGPLMVSVVAVGWRKLLGRELLVLASLFFLGFSIYVYMPLSTLNSPYVCWGNCHTWEGFMRHLLRVEYGSTRLFPDEKEDGRLMENLKFWYFDIQRETPYRTWAFGVVGIIAGFVSIIRRKTRGRYMEAAVAFAFLFYMIGFHILANFPLEGRPDNVEILMRFWMQPDTILMLYVADGLRIVVTFFTGLVGLASKAKTVLFSLCIGLVAVQVGMWYNWIDQSDNYAVPDFGRAMIKPLPPNALILTMGDITTNSVRYVQTAENYRTDVFLIDQNILSSEWFTELHAHNFPGVVFPDKKYWPGSLDGFDSREFLDVNFGNYRIFVFPNIKEESWAEEKEGGARYIKVPFGYTEEVVRVTGRAASPWDFQPKHWLATADDHVPQIPLAMSYPESKYPTGSWEYKPKDYFWHCMERYGRFALSLADVDKEMALNVAMMVFKRAASVAPHEGNYIAFHKSYGYTCYQSLEHMPYNEMVACMHEAWGKWTKLVRGGGMLVHGQEAHDISMREAEQIDNILRRFPLERDEE